MSKVLKAKDEIFPNNCFKIAFKSTENAAIRLTKPISKPMKTNESENCVYEMRCKICAEDGKLFNYIGETGRKLETRLKEHIRIPGIRKYGEVQDFKSPLAEHSMLVHGNALLSNWDAVVLKKTCSISQRKLMEARLIKEKKPNLNREFGVQFID